jgi:hypothetical protein
MKLISLTQGKFAKVDDEDYEWLNQHKWFAHQSRGRFCVETHTYGGYYNQQTLKMHRLILGITDGSVIVEHKDGDSLNNQRSNLRIATHSQNNSNRRRKDGKKHSVYIGVHKQVSFPYGIRREHWVAMCRHDNVKYSKHCKTEIEAALIYNELARRLHGEFARLHVIPTSKKFYS